MSQPAHPRSLLRFLETALVSALTGLMTVGPAAVARAGPEGASVQSGDVTITQTTPKDWEIRASDGSIIHYDRFDIAPDQWVKFVQDNADSRVLNRVFSENPTQILGRLSANGHVYLVNPAGVFIGNGARIDANGFHAAAGHISDQDFLAGRERFTDLKGSVTNEGTISGPDVQLSDDGASVVALAGRKVTNGALGTLLGKIYVDGEQGWIVLAAGTDVLISSAGDPFAVKIEGALAPAGDLKLENHGTLEAGRGRVGLAAGDAAGLALFHTQVSQPDGDALENRVAGSQILVHGGADSQVSVAGELNASSSDGVGGSIDISGTHVAVQDAKLLATGSAAGGSVSLSAQDGGVGSRAHAEAELAVADTTEINVSSAAGDGGSIALSTEGALDYRTRNTNLDGNPVEGSPGTFSVKASELVINGSAAPGQAAIASELLAAQGRAAPGGAGQGANLVLEGTDALRVASAANLSGAGHDVELRGAVDTRAAAVTAKGDLGVSGVALAVGDLTSQKGKIAIDGSGDVALAGRLSASDVSVDAGTGSSGSAAVNLESGAAFETPKLSIVQDASILSSAGSGVAAGDLAAIAARSTAPSLDYSLQSREGSIELRSESARRIDLVARARRGISVADAKLEARSADLGVDGAWKPGFAVDVDGQAALRAGLADGGDLTLEHDIDASEVTLAAGNGTTSSSDPDGSSVILAPDALAHLQGLALQAFRLEQDSSIAQPTQLGALNLADNASYALVSRLGGVSVAASELDKVTGEQVTLESRKGISLDFAGGARELGETSRMGSLALHSGDAHTVDYKVFTAGAASSIDIAAGVQRDAGDTVSGDLTLTKDAALYAQSVALAAGDGEVNSTGTNARVLIDPLAQFGREFVASGTPLAPRSFSLVQDDALGGPARPLPTRAQLGTSESAGTTAIALKSRLGSLTLDTTAVELLKDTHATLGALTPPAGFADDTSVGVRLTAATLDVSSLRVESDLIVDRTNAGTGGLVSVKSAGNIDLVGATPDVAGTRGNLLVRSSAKLAVTAAGNLSAGIIQSTPAPSGTPAAGFDADDSEFELLISALDLDVNQIFATGATDRDGGDVKISARDVTLGSLSADGGEIVANDDVDGGTVVIGARNLTVGNVFARGGLLASGLTPAAADGGKVQLSVDSGGLLDLVGTRYETREATGLGGRLELLGDMQLSPGIDATTGDPGSVFTVGDLLSTARFRVNDALLGNERVSAVVNASGAIDLQQGAQLGAGSLLMAAGSDISLGGSSVSAKKLLQLHVDSDGTGGGRFTPGAPLLLSSSEIRLGAGDPGSTTSDAALVAGDLARFTLTGPDGTGSPERFQLVQDRAVDLDGADALLPADRFLGGIAGMHYAVGSRRAGIALSNATVGDTHLVAVVAGTTGAGSSATPDAANGDVTVAGGALDVRSAQIDADRDLRVGFTINTPATADPRNTPADEDSSIRLLSGQTARGDLSVSGTLRADNIELIAGRAAAPADSVVKVDPAARFFRGTKPATPDAAPLAFTLEQDASLTDLPGLGIFGTSGLDGMGYSLVSHAGDVTLADASRVAGTQLSVSGRDVRIQSALSLANLDVKATGGVTVDAGVTASGNVPATTGTWAPSYIRLQSGSAGSNRNLEIGAVALSADAIALRAGTGSFDPATRGSALITFKDGARLGGLTESRRLAQLELEQDASFGGSGSVIPTGFIDADDLAGLDLALISNSGEITVASAAQAPLQGMALALHGARGVTLESGAAGGLSYASLVAHVGTTPENSVVPSLALQDSVQTSRGELNLLGDARLVGSGDRSLVARGGTGLVDGVVKVTGTLSRADGPVDGKVGDVSVEADDAVSIGAIDVSGSDARRNAGSVQVAALAGLAEVGSVRAVGRSTNDLGGNGGNVEIDGALVRVGGLDTGAPLGNAGSAALGTGLAADRVPGTARVEVGGNLSLLGQKPSGSTIEQAGRLVVGAPLALRAGGGLIDAGAIDLQGGVRLAGSGGVIGTGSEALRATARGRLTASGDLVASEVALAGRGASGELDLRQVDQVLADRISLEAGEGGATILLPADIAFRNLAGEDHPDAFRVTQDAALDFGGGANELVTRDNLVDPGGTLAGMELALESRQAQVHVVDPVQVDGTRLTLRGGGTSPVQVQVDGNLAVERLTLGSGNARVDGNLAVEGALASAGNLDVGGALAAIGGPVVLTADQDEQVVRVGAGGGTLALGGDVARQRTSGRGDLRLDARRVEFTSIQDQSIAAHGGVASDAPAGTLAEGKLVFTAADPLLKSAGGLTLAADTGIDLSGIAGRAPDGSQRNVVETFAGPLALRTRSGSTLLRGGLAASGGDLVADTSLDFRGATGETALRATGAVSALQGAQLAGQDLLLASGSGSVHTGGAFALEGGAFRPDSDLVVERDTSIQADGVFLRGATGPGDLKVQSTAIEVTGDVKLDPSSSLELAGSSIRLTKTGAQTLAAGSLALTRSGAGSGVLASHIGNLDLSASNGSLTTSAGAQLVATGDLTLSAANGISLGDSVAANTVTLLADRVSTSSGATVEANRITSSGETSGVYATPTGTEVSSELVNDRTVLRSLPGELTQEELQGFIDDPAKGIAPPTGPAIGDASDEAAIWPTAPRILGAKPGPRAGMAMATRPLWPDEVLAFLRRDPQSRGGLPDVAAGDAVTSPLHERLRTPEAERAASIYRDLFRPGDGSDPDAASARLAQLRALFEAAAEDQRGQGPLDVATLLEKVAGDPAHARALSVARRAADMLDSIRALGLAPADYSALRTRLVGPLAPKGIDADAFAEGIESI